MYPPGTTKIYSYLCARSIDKHDHAVFFGLQYLLKQYLSKPVTHADVDEFLSVREGILGPTRPESVAKFRALADLGYWPIRICAVPEGTIINNKNVLATFENTHPDFPWVVGYLESLLLKVWNTCSVATMSLQFRNLALDWAERTCDSDGHTAYQVHDFGYRGCSSEETAMVSGMAHLLSFRGTDTIPAVYGAKTYYGAQDGVGVSVPASEHSVMCAYGIDHEYDAFDHIMEVYPSGILSIVSDTYDVWNILTNYASSRRDVILARDGTVVFRPDGGYPPHIIAGDPGNPFDSAERAGAVELLDRIFGHTVNSKGYKVLNPKVGIIFGEGMTPERFDNTCRLLAAKGYASSNFVIGVGGLLLQRHNRDDLGFALKATYAEVNGERRNLMKNPKTSPNKKSHSGRLKLVEDKLTGEFSTVQAQHVTDAGALALVYVSGMHFTESFDTIRDRLSEYNAFRRGLRQAADAAA